MIRGLYTAASGMLAMQNRQEALANNIANINTAGYKADEGVLRSFPEQLLTRLRDQEGATIEGIPTFSGQPVQIGSLHTGVYMSEALPNFAQGDIAQTANPLDIALTDNLPIPANPQMMNGKPVQPKLFFGVGRTTDPTQAVETEEIRYSRTGNWSLNADGYVVTADGYYVLNDQNQPIRVADVEGAPNRNILISANGEVTLPGSDQPTQQLSLKLVENPNQLIRVGNNVYRTQEGQELPNVQENPDYEGFFAVRQGWVERSNVDASRTTTDMMTVLRAYEANQRVITTIDGTMDKAVNEIGRL